MKCHRSPDVHRLVDDELDAADRTGVERHVAGCAHCSEERRRIDALRHGLRDDALRYALPVSLLERVTRLATQHATQLVEDEEPRVDATIPSRRRASSPRWYWLGSGALGGAAMTAGVFALVTALDATRVDHRLADEAVAAHGRAATTGHLVDVTSSDRHTVKPWLSQHLDYSPPVPDLAADGFTLVGGRLDRLDRMPVATLVYGYGQHTIDVFVRPSDDGGGTAEPAVVRGFNVVQSRGSGMDWLGVSDVNAAQLELLMRRLAGSHGGTGSEPAR